MSDLVSRKGVLKILTDISYNICKTEAGADDINTAKLMVIAMPSAEPEPHWIPVSERSPEYGVAVLTYDGHCFCVEKRIPTIRDDEGEPITGDWWVSDDYDEYDGDYYPNLRDGACIAWIPLPEPYRAERRTDDLQ